MSNHDQAHAATSGAMDHGELWSKVRSLLRRWDTGTPYGTAAIDSVSSAIVDVIVPTGFSIVPTAQVLSAEDAALFGRAHRVVRLAWMSAAEHGKQHLLDEALNDMEPADLARLAVLAKVAAE